MTGQPNALFYGDFNSNRSYNVLFKTRSSDESQAQVEAFDDR